MTTIDASQRLAIMLRREVSAFRHTAPSAATGRGKPSAAADVATVVARRIHALDRDDPERAGKAVRIFLETVFLQELGPQLVHDPAFGRMVDAVQAQMQADADLAGALAAVGKVLLAGRA